MQGSLSGLDTWSLPPSAPTVPLSPWKGPGNPLRGLPFPVPETFRAERPQELQPLGTNWQRSSPWVWPPKWEIFLE